MSTDQFAGPLFLLGMPRSGTKLLRTLLNAHPAIHIAQVETHFIPYWHANWDSYDDLADLQNFRKFYDKALIWIIGHPSLGVAGHIWWCRRHGIDWLTCEPRDRYLELRPWAKEDAFENP